MSRLREIVGELNADLDALKYPRRSPGGRYRIVVPKGQYPNAQGTKIFDPEGREVTGVMAVNVAFHAGEVVTARIKVRAFVEEAAE